MQEIYHFPKVNLDLKIGVKQSLNGRGPYTELCLLNMQKYMKYDWINLVWQIFATFRGGAAGMTADKFPQRDEQNSRGKVNKSNWNVDNSRQF